jgi:D-alanine-D-alanine ligase-like ATP-grasp enzyme
MSNTHLYLKLLRVKHRLSKAVTRLLGVKDNTDMSNYIDVYKEIWENAAKDISAEFFELSQGLWKISYDGHATLVNNYRVQLDDPVTLNLVGNKALCYSLMAQEGLPVPEYESFRLDELHKAKQFMKRLKGSLFVVKPATGTSGGRGVTTHISSYMGCLTASALAALYSDQIIIERFIPGESYRILVLNGRVIHASRRRGARVTGDGRSTVWQLVQNENHRRRESVGTKLATIANSDRDYQATLLSQGLSDESIPNEGREVLIRSSDLTLKKSAEVLTVFNEDATGLICRQIADSALTAARTIASEFAGVDIITVDPSVSLEDSGGVINEINTTPGLHHHYSLINEKHSDAAKRVLEHLLRISSEKAIV